MESSQLERNHRSREGVAKGKHRKGLPMNSSNKTNRAPPPIGTAEEGVVRHPVRQRPQEPLSRDPGDIVDDANRDQAATPRPVEENR